MQENRIKFNSVTFCIVIKINNADTEITLILYTAKVKTRKLLSAID